MSLLISKHSLWKMSEESDILHFTQRYTGNLATANTKYCMANTTCKPVRLLYHAVFQVFEETPASSLILAEIINFFKVGDFKKLGLFADLKKLSLFTFIRVFPDQRIL